MKNHNQTFVNNNMMCEMNNGMVMCMQMYIAGFLYAYDS